ncbi:MAG: ComEC/Rec2 family competence protein, partial [Acidobacteriota bacterium]
VDAGITHLAGVVLTHPHHDHGDGLHSVFEQLNVDEFWVTHLDSSSLQRALIDDAATHHVAIRTMRQGSIVERGTARLTCLHPSAHPTRKSNDGSMVLLVEVTDDGSILLPGDLEADGEARLRASGALRPVTVLKVAHHGSHTSTTASFLAAVRPAAAIISVGAGNPWGHPDDPVLDRLRALGVTVGRTDRDGAVTVTLVHGVPQLERMRRP